MNTPANLGRGHRRRMAAEGLLFPWRLNRSTISAKLELIWGMSAHESWQYSWGKG